MPDTARSARTPALSRQAPTATPLLVDRAAATAWAYAATVAFALLWLAVLVSDGNLAVDHWWHDLALADRGSTVAGIAAAFAVFGGVTVSLILRVVVAVVLAVERRWAAFAAFAVGCAATTLCVEVVKAATVRPRPPDIIRLAGGSSFPSGHAAAAIAAALLLVVCFTRSGNRQWWFALAAAYGVAMGVSRTVVAAHWLTDVAGGLCLGTAVALWTVLAVDAVTRRRTSGP